MPSRSWNRAGNLGGELRSYTSVYERLRKEVHLNCTHAQFQLFKGMPMGYLVVRLCVVSVGRFANIRATWWMDRQLNMNGVLNLLE